MGRARSSFSLVIKEGENVCACRCCLVIAFFAQARRVIIQSAVDCHTKMGGNGRGAIVVGRRSTCHLTTRSCSSFLSCSLYKEGDPADSLS